MTEQRRVHPRYAIELDCSVSTGDAQLKGRTQNLSMGGFCFEASQALPAGSICMTSLALVFSDNQFSEHLKLEAEVMWCTVTRAGYQIGVKFAPLDAASRGYLDLFIQFLEGPEGDDDEESG
jgi:hypothetical protein